MSELIKGFSKLTKEDKIRIVSERSNLGDVFAKEIGMLDYPDAEIQKRMDGFSENTIANFAMPFGVAPNFLINGKWYIVPMVIEESSVVAAAASAARFWSERGGFNARIIDILKNGQVHFTWNGDPSILNREFDDIRNFLLQNTRHLTKRMEERGGGVKQIELRDMTHHLEAYYQLFVQFDTAESMGANFINSVLEEMGHLLKKYLQEHHSEQKGKLEIIMAILSNYTPECMVEVEVECSYEKLNDVDPSMSGTEFAGKFKKAIEISRIDAYRAVTHNKGIFNGIDAVVLATGNDFRAVEAAGHAYASRGGRYAGLSYVRDHEDKFIFGLRIPLSMGTIGGLTSLHPLAGWSFKILGQPDVRELMTIAAAAGLANNFSAIRSLITKGIQSGHMKMHLGNILSFLKATDKERNLAFEHFQNRTVSYNDVNQYLQKIRLKK